MNPKQPRVLVCLFFLATTALFYRNGIIAPPNTDQELFARERAYVTSETAFIWRAACFARDRTVKAIDLFLFRPVTSMANAIMDAQFHANLFAMGLPSLFLHALTGFSLYLLFSQLLPLYWALGLSALFTVHASNMELILERHVSYYMFALLFFALGIHFLLRFLEKSKKTAWNSALLCFLVASFSHEVVSLALIATAALLALRLSSPQKKFIVTGLLIPAAIFWAVNLYDWNSHRPPIALTSFHLSPDFYPLVYQTLRVSGLSFYALLFPHRLVVKQNPNFPDNRWEWDYSDVSEPLQIALGFLVIALSVAAIFWPSKNIERIIQRTAFGLFFLLFVSILALGRVVPRGNHHFLASSYYYLYFSTFLLVGLGASFLSNLKKPFLVASLLYGTLSSWFVIQGRTETPLANNIETAKGLLAIQTLLAQKPNACYAGFLGKGISIPSGALFRESCGFREGDPQFAVHHKEWELISLPKITYHSVLSRVQKPLTAGRFLKEEEGNISIDFRVDPAEDSSVALFPLEKDWVEFSIETSQLENLGLIFGYKDALNYSAVVIYHSHGLGVASVRDGQSFKILSPAIVGNLDPLRIGLRRVGNQLFLTRDHVLYRPLEGIILKDLKGRLGVFSSKGTFEEILVGKESDFPNKG